MVVVHWYNMLMERWILTYAWSRCSCREEKSNNGSVTFGILVDIRDMVTGEVSLPISIEAVYRKRE